MQAVANVSLPFGMVMTGSAGRQRNGYRTASAAIGRPRRDRIDGWTVGLGRVLGRRAHLRIDYRTERRDSNLDGLDSRAHGFVFQFGLLASPRSS
jgi:hypothetical protein